MRKRRRLANKMTIMVCAVLIAVSAFFYAPMDVDAEEVYQGSVTSTGGNVADFSYWFADSYGTFDNNVVYELNYTVSGDIVFDSPCYLRSISINYGGISFYVNNRASNGAGSMNVHSFDYSGIRYLTGNFLNSSNFVVNASCIGLPKGSNNFTSSLSIVMNSITPLTGEDSASYQQGYNAGYSAGEQVGESNGYSSGYSDGYEAGEQSGYDSGFQAGSDSVDTQSYYDAGYQAGYDFGYASGYDAGYDTGYDAGWSAYEAQMDKWGADTSDYPVLKYSFFEDELGLICDVHTSAPSTSYDSALLCYFDFDINPNHTYKFVVRTGGTTGGTYKALYSDYKLNFVIGSNVINATNNIDKTFDFFIPGYNMGSSILFEAFVYDCVYYGGVSEEDGFLKDSGQVYPTLKNCYIDIYDMGPSGDTQNHIANQTDQLTNGYDDSKGNQVNSELSTGLNEFETAENSLFATATTGMKDFTFFDFESIPAMITGMSFVGSIMSSWFNQAGGASGVGIVLSILFSIMLVAMVLGLYRWYQSKGGKD